MHHHNSNASSPSSAEVTAYRQNDHLRMHNHGHSNNQDADYPHLVMNISVHQNSCSSDFRVPNTPSLVSSSTCSSPVAAIPSHVIMRPPPPPPPPPTTASLTIKVPSLRQNTAVAQQELKISSHEEEPSSSIPDLEFDGTTVLCRVCGDKASGFHYGVHSCEGCKGFFRRSIQQKIQYRPCTKNQQCSILRINRNRCQYCRLKKCIAVGMSRDAVRFGRVPKREKARILAAMQQSTNSRSHEKALTAELEDDQRLLSTVVRAHLDTCDFTSDKVQPILIQARTHPSFTACPPSLACPLNPNPQPLTGQQELLQDFSKRFSPAIRGVVEFAKRITGFSLLPQDDQVTLLKAGVFEVLLVRLACMFDSQTNSMICLNGQVLKRDSIHNSSNARFLMDSMFDFAERLNNLNLSDAEIGLFSSIVVIAPNRPGLRNVELIEKMHNKLKALLQTVLSQNHPEQPNLCQELIMKIPDLRTLNTLHSEKLLAFKMTEQQQLQQQQHNSNNNNSHHHNNNNSLWNDVKIKVEEIKSEDMDGKSPVGSSSWSSGSDAAAIDEVKSPMGSVSSTESMCSGEVASLNEAASGPTIHHHHVSSLASNAPLLAATLAGGICPMRRRENSGSDEELQHHQHHNHHHVLHHHNGMMSNGLVKTTSVATTKVFRKLDSPADSGIESGTEKIDKIFNSSAPTSVCSSPRSSSEEKEDGQHHHSHHHQQNGSHNHALTATIISSSSRPTSHLEQSQLSSAMNGHHHQAHRYNINSSNSSGSSIEDMPVLKRVLQAPPLYDTNSLMDEAYKPHKKFRALRNKDTAEAEPAVIVSNVSTSNPTVNNAVNYVNNRASPNYSSGGSPIAHNGHTSPSVPSPISAAAATLSPASSPHLQYQLTSSSLSSTHTTLARSLMEGPQMTPEQMKRTDIIHRYIMRGVDAAAPLQELNVTVANNRGSPPYQMQPSSSYILKQHSPPQAPPPCWDHSSPVMMPLTGMAAATSVITSSASIVRPSAVVTSRIPSPMYSAAVNERSTPNNVIRSQPSSPSSGSQLFYAERQQQSPVAAITPGIFIRPPNLSPSACSPPLHYVTSSPGNSGIVISPATSPNQCASATVSALNPNFSPSSGSNSSGSTAGSNSHYVISTHNNGSSSINCSTVSQPLNLSKKTPPSSPRPLSANSSTPKIVSLEA